MPKKTSILVVEDDGLMQTAYQDRLELDFDEVIIVGTIYDGHQAFRQHDGEFDVMIMDFQVPLRQDSGTQPNGPCNTINLVRRIRRSGFTNPIIAASSMHDCRNKLKEAGCSHDSEKRLAARLAIALLRGEYPAPTPFP